MYAGDDWCQVMIFELLTGVGGSINSIPCMHSFPLLHINERQAAKAIDAWVVTSIRGLLGAGSGSPP
jgi:hypothetical protein